MAACPTVRRASSQAMDGGAISPRPMQKQRKREKRQSTIIDALNYKYDGLTRLEQINRGSYNGCPSFQQAYHFTLDNWGNTESIRVWDQTAGTAPTASNSTELAHYVYNANGTLARMCYPNGDSVAYAYDLLDRLISEAYYNSSNTIYFEYRYVYNANGQLSRQYALQNDAVVVSYTFEYDSLGRLIRSREEAPSGTVQRTEHELEEIYDSSNTNGDWAYTDSTTVPIPLVPTTPITVPGIGPVAIPVFG